MAGQTQAWLSLAASKGWGWAALEAATEGTGMAGDGEGLGWAGWGL